MFVSLVIYLSTIGLTTSKFNNLIIEEVEKRDSNIELKLEKIKIKLDIKNFQLFLSTREPKFVYRNIKIPIKGVKIYSKINKIFASKIDVSTIIFEVEKFKVKDIQNIAIRIKPSNFKTYLLNNINGGEIENALFYLSTNKNFELVDYKVNGTIKKITAKIVSEHIIKDISFNFIIDNTTTLVSSISASYKGISISNGSIDLQRKKEIEIKGKFNTFFDFKEDKLNKLFKKVKFFKGNKIKIEGSMLHDFDLKINNNFKITDYNYKSSGNIPRSEVILKKNFKNSFLKKSVNKILLENIKLKVIFSQKNKNLILFDGLYSLDNSGYLKFKVKNNLNKKNQNYLIDLDLNQNIIFNLINYKKKKNTSNIKVEYAIKNKKLFFKTIEFIDGKNNISVKGLVLNSKKEIEKLSTVKVLTFDNNKENNNFTINFEKKISITGKKYDSSSLLKFLSEPKKSNLLKRVSKELEVQIKNLITNSNTGLSNFNLIGLIEKGKLSKMSAKGEFSKNKYLDISLKKTPDKKKILEIYSDDPQALLGGYNFFEGIKDGKLLYNSIIDETSSSTKLIIENFKVIKAPTFATLLTLADLGGVADLLSGRGISFEILEIRLQESKSITTVEELLALGSSVSLHMEGYIEKETGLVSLSGTLVPAKTLNRLISKIPVVGNILVGDRTAGEGIFGVSFKMKGLPGKIKTTVNPVKTITPRFITRAIEKIKKK